MLQRHPNLELGHHACSEVVGTLTQTHHGAWPDAQEVLHLQAWAMALVVKHQEQWPLHLMTGNPMQFVLME